MVRAVEFATFGWAARSWPDAPSLLVLLGPPAGGLLVGIVLHWRDVPEDPGHGVTEVIQAATLDAGEFPHRRVPLKVSLAAVSLGSGASLGPEDPSVEIGGGLGEALARRAKLPHDAVRWLVAAGGAGGISALLHTPLAGILFSVEVFAARVRSHVAPMVVVSSITAYLGMRVLSPEPGLDVALTPDQARPPVLAGMILCLLIGLLAGLVSVLQIRLSYGARYLFLHWRTPPRWIKPALGGVLLGSAGIVLPQLLGIGYETIEELTREEPWTSGLLMALLVGKVLLVAVSFGSGLLGGFFAPAFFVGAMLGGLFGSAAAGLLPAGPDPATLVVIGMAAALAGMVHAPLTATVTVAALAGTVWLTPFLLVACLVSQALARRLLPASLYTYPLMRRLREAAEGDEEFGRQPDLD